MRYRLTLTRPDGSIFGQTPSMPRHDDGLYWEGGRLILRYRVAELGRLPRGTAAPAPLAFLRDDGDAVTLENGATVTLQRCPQADTVLDTDRAIH